MSGGGKLSEAKAMFLPATRQQMSSLLPLEPWVTHLWPWVPRPCALLEIRDTPGLYLDLTITHAPFTATGPEESVGAFGGNVCPREHSLRPNASAIQYGILPAPLESSWLVFGYICGGCRAKHHVPTPREI